MAQRHYDMMRKCRERMPGRREGQILSYPQRKWVKKRYQYLQHFMLPKHLRYIAESAPILGETPVIGVIITLFFFYSATQKLMQPLFFLQIPVFLGNTYIFCYKSANKMFIYLLINEKSIKKTLKSFCELHRIP